MKRSEDELIFSRKSKQDIQGSLFELKGTSIVEDMLKENSFLKSIFINAPAGIAICNLRDFSIIDINEAFCDILGYTKEELMAKKVYDLSSKEVFESEVKLFSELNKHGINTYRYDKPYIHKDGHTVWCDLTFNRIPLPGSESELAIGIVVDISANLRLKSENLKAIEELKVLNADKDKFFNIIAHDLRSPLTGIMQMQKFIADNFDTLAIDEIKEMIIGLKDSTNQIFNLLENLLHWSMSQTKKLRAVKTTFNLKQVVEEIVRLLSELAHQKQIDIIPNCECEVTINADREMIKTIFRNLISNAIKFTPKSGQIYLNCICNDDKIKISITDTGIGMPIEMVNSTFNLSHSNKRPGTDGEIGSGLGLILCKEFAKMNDGDISIESEIEKGTTVTLCLPAYDIAYC